MSDATCWVVSPMLRDTESFLRLRSEVLTACAADERIQPVRFLVVDDSAGTDPDVAVLDDLADVEVLTPAFNLGHQRAIVLGLRSLLPRLTPSDVVVTMDSDGEDQPSDVPRLLTALDDGTAVLALAQRTQRSESLMFRVLYLAFRAAFRFLTGTTVRSGNFAAQSAASLAATIHHPSFDLCYSSTLLELKRPTVKVPCARGHRFAGVSRMNSYALIAHGVRMLLPLSERIAVRMMLTAAGSAGALIIGLLLNMLGVFDEVSVRVLASLFAAVMLVFGSSFVTFVVLFSSFAASRGGKSA